jgi:hypothetical protein
MELEETTLENVMENDEVLQGNAGSRRKRRHEQSLSPVPGIDFLFIINGSSPV